jgi:hypothetical protein
MKLLVSTLFLLVSAVSVLPQTKRTATIKQINQYVSSIDEITDRKKEPDLVVADTSDYDDQIEKWQAFKSSKDLEKFREGTETYSIANNWRSNGKIVATVFTFFSPSGDWAQYATHYFRTDGSAAKVTMEMRTFNGDYIIIREMYFTPRGKLLKRTVKYLDLTTKKPKKPAPEMLDDSLEKVYYKSVSGLPFYSLTKAKI